MTAFTGRKIWLDADPGHDDAIALLLALYLKDELKLVGMSSVNGNAPLIYTHANAAQLLALYRADKTLPLHRGLVKPLRKEYMHPPVDIHGHSGLDGVANLPPLSHPSVQHFYSQFESVSTIEESQADGTAVEALHNYLLDLPDEEKITIVITGPCTNIAALREKSPDLYDQRVERVVIMGGALDIPQWTPFAEFNIFVDPDALGILLESDSVPVVLVPLNVTHQAIFDVKTHARLLDPSVTSHPIDQPLPKATSPLREHLSTMLNFFGEAYAKLGFATGPPLHDALTILHLTHPDLITGRWANLSVDISKTERDGETKAEFYSTTPNEWEDGVKYRKEGKKVNALILENLDHDAFFEILHDVVNRADENVKNTPL